MNILLEKAWYLFGFRHFNKTGLNASLKYMPKYSGNEYELRVGRVKMEDKGNYVVRATNSFGSKEESAALGVESMFLLNIRIKSFL